MNVLWLILSIGAWGVVHSLLASLSVKAALLKRLGPGPMRLYRFGYNVFAVISFLPIAWLMFTLPDQPFYQVPAPWSYLMLAGQVIAAVLLVAAFLQTGPLSFLGLRQLFEKEEPGPLVTNGLYRFVRHPLYATGLLLLWLTPAATVNRFVVMTGPTIYLLAGVWFEERKLLREFGESYAAYRRKTPMLIPRLRPKQ